MALSRDALLYKGRAALVSLALFLVFAALLSFLTWRLWFPDYLFTLDGGLQGLRIVLAVEFVLGPVLVLVFFHPEKSRGKLIFDLVVVGMIQLGAMFWGTWQIWQQRPIGVVFGNHRFVSVEPDIMSRQRVDAADLRRFSPDAPPYVFRREPRTGEEQQRAYVMLMRYSFHPESHAFLFDSFLPNLDRVFTQQDALRRFVSKQMPGAWERFAVDRSSKGMESYRLAFFEGRYGNAVLVFSPEGQWQGYLPMEGKGIPNLDDKPAATSVSQ
ncbi:MAG TPA: hypothetical protein VFM34_12160 [Moraxellaceae bacterium]|nr:hypothetical protein [Moraxellaceae bacterium]